MLALVSWVKILLLVIFPIWLLSLCLDLPRMLIPKWLFVSCLYYARCGIQYTCLAIGLLILFYIIYYLVTFFECFTGCSCYNIGCYNYSSMQPYYIVIHLTCPLAIWTLSTRKNVRIYAILAVYYTLLNLARISHINLWLKCTWCLPT